MPQLTYDHLFQISLKERYPNDAISELTLHAAGALSPQYVPELFETPPGYSLSYQKGSLADIIHTMYPITNELMVREAKGLNPWLWAVSNLESDTFYHLIKSASEEEINALMLLFKPKLLGETGPNDQEKLLARVFRACLCHQHDAALGMALLEKLDDKMVEALMVFQDATGNNLLHSATQLDNNTTLVSHIIKRTTLKTLQQSMSMLNHAGETPLYTALNNQSDMVCLALLEKASAEGLEQALFETQPEGCTLLHLAAKRNHKAILLVLLAKIPADALNRVVLHDNAMGNTPLHDVIVEHDLEVVKTFTDRLTANNLSKALVVKNKNTSTPLHLIAIHHRSLFPSFMHTIPNHELKDVLMITETNGLSLFQLATHFLSAEDYVCLLQKLKTNEIDALIVSTTPDNETVLSMAFHDKKLSNFNRLAEMISPSILHYVLLLKNHEGQCLLEQLVLEPDLCHLAILQDKLQPETIHQLWSIRNEQGQSLLHSLLISPNADRFSMLLRHTSLSTLIASLLIKQNETRTLAWVKTQCFNIRDKMALIPWLMILEKLSGIYLRTADDYSKLMMKRADLMGQLPNPFSVKLVNFLIDYLGSFFLTGKQRLDEPSFSFAPTETCENAIFQFGLGSWDAFYALEKNMKKTHDGENITKLLSLMGKYDTLHPKSLMPHIHDLFAIYQSNELGLMALPMFGSKEWNEGLQRLSHEALSVNLFTPHQIKPFNPELYETCIMLAFRKPALEPGQSANPFVVQKQAVLAIVMIEDTPRSRRLAARYQHDLEAKLEQSIPISLWAPTKNQFIEDLKHYESEQSRQALWLERDQIYFQQRKRSQGWLGFFNNMTHHQRHGLTTHAGRRLEEINNHLMNQV